MVLNVPSVMHIRKICNTPFVDEIRDIIIASVVFFKIEKLNTPVEYKGITRIGIQSSHFAKKK
jgi:hypothetical protein